jgi:formyl-CoA transferase
MIIEAGETESGPVRLIGSPIDMSAAPVRVRIPPPHLGQHNDEILRSIEVRRGDAA